MVAGIVALQALGACGASESGDAPLESVPAPAGAAATPLPASTLVPPTPILTTTALPPPPVRPPTVTPIARIMDRDYVEIVNDRYYNAFPGMAQHPDGVFVVVYRRGVLHATDKGTIVMRTSSDLGKTWSSERPVVSHPKLDLRDPNIVRLGDGTLVVNYFEYDGDKRSTVANGIKIVRSRDGGVSWGPPVEVRTGARAATSAPVIELPGGDLLLAYYGSFKGDSQPSAWVVRSVDGGSAWGQEVVIGDGPAHGKPYQEPNLVLLDKGGILATIRSDGQAKIIHTSVSSDSGATWSSPLPRFIGSGTPSVLQLASGDLVTIYRSKLTRHFGWPALRISSDGGDTWTADEGEVVIDRVDGPMMYASLLEMADGAVAVAYGMEYGQSHSEIRFRYVLPGGD